MKQLLNHYWEEGKTIHLCEIGEGPANIKLVWTTCEIDVPANESFTTAGTLDVNCAKCLGVDKNGSGQ